MAGWENDVAVCKNLNFDETAAKPHLGVINAAGKIPIGTGNTFPTPEILGGSLTSPDSSLVIGYVSPNITLQVAAGSTVLKTLSDDVGTVVTPSGGNIQLVGHVFQSDGVTKTHTTVAGSNLININPMSSAKWIVDPQGFNGTHTTLTGALASAAAGDTIAFLPGTYAESATIDKNIYLVCSVADGRGLNSNVTLTGTLTISAAEINVGIYGFNLSNTDTIINLSGTGSNVTLVDCTINISGSSKTALINSGPSTANIYVYSSFSSVGDTCKLFDQSGAGVCWFYYSKLVNFSGTPVASTCSDGNVRIFSSTLNVALASSSTGIYLIENSSLGTQLTPFNNTTWLTTAGTALHIITNCSFYSGTASCISIGSGTTVQLTRCTISSTNTNAISGAGTLIYSGLTFTGTSSIVNTTTQTGLYVDLGKYNARAQPGALAYKSANATNATGNNVVYTLICDTEIYDTDSNYNNGTGVWTAPEAGKYSVKAFVSTLIGASGATMGALLLAATSRSLVLANQGVLNIGYNGSITFSGSAIIDMNAGDTFTITLQMGAGTQTVTVVGDASYNTYFEVQKVA